MYEVDFDTLAELGIGTMVYDMYAGYPYPIWVVSGFEIGTLGRYDAIKFKSLVPAPVWVNDKWEFIHLDKEWRFVPQNRTVKKFVVIPHLMGVFTQILKQCNMYNVAD